MTDADSIQEDSIQWFFLRDLKRPNAKEHAFQTLSQRGFEVFTPMKIETRNVGGKRVRMVLPYINDMLFVHSQKNVLDEIIAKTPTLQYRYVTGRKYCEPLTIRDEDMEKFITAVKYLDKPRYYLPQEITSGMRGRRIRIIDGPMVGYEGQLLSVKGSRKKRLIVEIPSCIAVAVEITPECIEVINE
ncbi:MAG: UpxY family transcription antiterminator [Bacteroidales bacterium]|nr:UpxY family transcription antiterminator [Bacteroidales bacterium]MDY6002566.1 UpxY family transcription antiterminator [Candidatus Cryptobacteroides sp.]